MSLLKNIGEGFLLGLLSPIILVGLGIAWLYEEIFPDKERTGLAIFGMQESGKTTIFNHLRNENYGAGTTIRPLNEFEYKLENGKTRLIKKGVDIGGGEEFIRKNYEPMLLDENYDVYFFVFNSYKYLNELKEQLDVDARIQFIQKKNINNKKIYLIGSYFDKFTIDESNVRTLIRAKVKDKTYSSLFSENLVLMDLTSKSILTKFFNQKAFV
ncbi:GTPase domain-containing protein [Flavobacterium sp. DSR3-2]|uniref:GTPase domain-containing protein n=1 Tax=Flavobacterium sp. DSR3-2 TaxID=2804634 RepID=UPI003CF93CC4